jgi:hypothetical protein
MTSITESNSKLVQQIEFAEQVGRLHLQGKDATTIARQLDVPRAQVTRALGDFRALLRKNSESAVDVRDRLMDILYEADESFRMVIDEAWETVKQADDQGSLAVKVQAMKLVESATKNRADALHKSGVSQDDEIIEQLNETERRHAIFIELLKEIKLKHPQVSELISRALTKAGDQVDVIEVVDTRQDSESD